MTISQQLTIRHERFCREVVKDMLGKAQGAPARPQYVIYKAAGYAGHRSNASALMANHNTQARIAELLADGVTAEDVDPDVIVKGLLNEALNAKSDGARVSAWKTLAQVRAMLQSVHVSKVEGFTDTQLATMVSGFDPEVPEAGGNKRLYLEVLQEIGAHDLGDIDPAGNA